MKDCGGGRGAAQRCGVRRETHTCIRGCAGGADTTHVLLFYLRPSEQRGREEGEHRHTAIRHVYGIAAAFFVLSCGFVGARGRDGTVSGLGACEVCAALEGEM